MLALRTKLDLEWKRLGEDPHRTFVALFLPLSSLYVLASISKGLHWSKFVSVEASLACFAAFFAVTVAVRKKAQHLSFMVTQALLLQVGLCLFLVVEYVGQSGMFRPVVHLSPVFFAFSITGCLSALAIFVDNWLGYFTQAALVLALTWMVRPTSFDDFLNVMRLPFYLQVFWITTACIRRGQARLKECREAARPALAS